MYNHLESEEALFDAIIGLMFDETHDAVDVGYVPGRPFRDQLVDLGRAEGRLLRSRPSWRELQNGAVDPCQGSSAHITGMLFIPGQSRTGIGGCAWGALAVQIQY